MPIPNKLDRLLALHRRHLVLQALVHAGGDVAAAAAFLELSEQALRAILAELGLGGEEDAGDRERATGAGSTP
jgi:DNA-binding NtrC family response regulator